MTTILQVNSSILASHSVSRLLTREIVQKALTLHPGANVVERDLAATPPPHLSGLHLAAMQTQHSDNPQVDVDLKQAKTIMDEVFQADVIVVGAPMYNFSLPSQLKAWIDRLVVAGKTFRYGPNGPEGLLPQGKKAIIASARGGVYTGQQEFQESYLEVVLRFIGIQMVTIIRAEGVSMGDAEKQVAIDKARQMINALTSANS